MAIAELELLDYKRRVLAVYARVRETARSDARSSSTG